MMTKEILKQALEALESENPYHGYLAAHAIRNALEEPAQEPPPWRDMVVVSLVREGINKHKARELADHFAAQPEQEPVACRFCHSKKGCWAWQCDSCGEIDDVQKPTPLPVQEPVAWGWRYDSCGHAVANRLVATETSEPTLFLKNVFARGPFPLYAAPQPVQEPLTHDEIEAIGDKVANEKLVGPVANFRVRFARAIEAAHNIKEKT